ncbi:hypothetical protein J8I29_26525 [Labrys sp. LIt4]|uniref:hypothetical protein n=1 Tax=Labrys sp. LIt4 TaxID=2821355 RepID=UPI001ADF4B64|nr:hypothetical protein [Labrys sp. LIt4]MBP0582910.1 hypothetical protein [Labrys sp. LIt4]
MTMTQPIDEIRISVNRLNYNPWYELQPRDDTMKPPDIGASISDGETINLSLDASAAGGPETYPPQCRLWA